MNELKYEDLDPLAIGAAILGSGGGGNPAYKLLMAKQQLGKSKTVKIIPLQDLPDDALVLPVAFMGAPLVTNERIPSGREFIEMMKVIENDYGKKVTHLISGEIGGGNALTPIIAASLLDLPVVDGDTIGRAFPELQMTTCNIHGISPQPAFLTSCLGKTEIIYGKNAMETENLCRKATIKVGSSAALGIYLMDGLQTKKTAIPGSISLAIQLGREKLPGDYIGEGIIVDIDQTIEAGFLSGTVLIKGIEDEFLISYQNEYLALYKNRKLKICTPDIITLIEAESGKPILSESLMYGQRVKIITLPSPDIWKTKKGLELVGPKYFKIRENI